MRFHSDTGCSRGHGQGMTPEQALVWTGVRRFGSIIHFSELNPVSKMSGITLQFVM